MASSFGWFATTSGGHGKRRADFRAASATVLCQENQEVAHGGKIDAIADRPALTARKDQPGVRKNEKLRRHRVRRSIEGACDLARRDTLRAGFYQQAKDLQA